MRWMIFLQEQSRARLYTPEFRAHIPEQTGDLVRAGLEDALASFEDLVDGRIDLCQRARVVHAGENGVPR